MQYSGCSAHRHLALRVVASSKLCEMTAASLPCIISAPLILGPCKDFQKAGGGRRSGPSPLLSVPGPASGAGVPGGLEDWGSSALPEIHSSWCPKADWAGCKSRVDSGQIL